MKTTQCSPNHFLLVSTSEHKSVHVLCLSALPSHSCTNLAWTDLHSAICVSSGDELNRQAGYSWITCTQGRNRASGRDHSRTPGACGDITNAHEWLDNSQIANLELDEKSTVHLKNIWNPSPISLTQSRGEKKMNKSLAATILICEIYYISAE
jgi:hypothetical protein